MNRQQSGLDPIIDVRNLAVSFHGAPPVVEGVSFSLLPGQCLAFVGESGSGKSVTARALIGLAGRGAQMTADRARVGRFDILEMAHADWRALRGRHVAMVLQDALTSLDPLRRVGAEVAESMLAARPRLDARTRSARTLELLSSVGVPDAAVRARQYPHQLSGGLRQRSLIAQSLGAEPEVIIADEPTTALDVTVQAQVLSLLESIRQQGKAIILISHDLAVVSRMADYTIVMRAGEVVEEGPTLEILRAPRTAYTRRLIDAIPTGADAGTRLSAESPVDATALVGARTARQSGGVPVIQARDVRKSYPNPGGGVRIAVNDISFELAQGEILGVVGESGSGKSTLGQLVLGLTEPDGGEVLLDGQTWSALPERERRRRRLLIQPVSQDPLGSFDPRHRVQRIIGDALTAARVPRSARREMTLRLLSAVGLDERHIDRRPATLSGGQRQRVAIARALATSPEILVCDEAVSALDVSVQAQVLDLIVDLRDQLGISVIFISHDLGVVHHLSDRVLVMKEGRVVESGPVDEVFHHPSHEYTKSLLSALMTVPQLDDATTRRSS